MRGAATVILLTALTVMFMVGGQSESFNNWMNNTQGDAECSLLKTEYENTCSNSPGNAPSVRDDALGKSCGWAEEISSCDQLN